MKSKTENETTAAPKVVLIENLDQLRGIMEPPFTAHILFDGRPVAIPLTRMSHATNEKCRVLYRKAKPPFVQSLNKGNGGYDELDSKYLEATALNMATARSLTIYCHCPLVSGSKPGLMEEAKIHEYVSGIFPEVILDALALAIRGSGVQIDLEGLRERTNFT